MHLQAQPAGQASQVDVFMPGASMLAESIDCMPGTDDDGRLFWYYRWSWGEVLHDASDPPGAAAKIAEVLAAR